MKNFVLFASICLLSIVSFLHLNQENEVIDLSYFKSTIHSQNECIDELEESLYYVSTENILLKKEISVLAEENSFLKKKVLKYEIQLAKLRKRVTNLELDVNSARTKYHILKTDRTRIDPIIASNESMKASKLATVGDDQFQKVIAEAKADLKNKKQALILAKRDLEGKENSLAVIKDKATKNEKAIIIAENKLEEIGDKEPKIVVAVKEKKSNTNDKLNKAQDMELDEPKLYFVESGEKKKVELNEVIASVSATSEFTSKSPIYNLVENTSIKYEYVSCRRDKFGKKIKKLKSNGKNWKFTFIQFNMENPIFSNLLEQHFRVKIQDLDNNSYLPLTTNRLVAYDECHDFTYEGEPVQLAFYHEGLKNGLNYKVELYLVDGDEEYLLEESSKQIFSEGISLDSSL